jgi:hypothetical protein
MKLSVSLRVSRSYTAGRTPWTADQLVARPLPLHKHRNTQTLNIHSWVEFEPTIPVSERAKTVLALDRSAAVTGWCQGLPYRKNQTSNFSI